MRRALLEFCSAQAAKSRSIGACFRHDSSGTTAMEYGIIALLIAVALIAAISKVGSNIIPMFNKVATAIGSI